MRTKILSIIIPIYNSAKYLNRCIDSLLQQGFEEGAYEIILVNDGSSDNSLSICEDYQKRFGDDLIKIINQPNQGVSEARNNGLKTAQGDYVNFIDSDDYLIPNGLGYLVKNYLDSTIDILSYWSLTLDRNTYKNFKEKNKVEGKIYFENDGVTFLSENVQTSVVTSLYRRKFLVENKLRFRKLCIGEDVFFNLQTCLMNPKIRMVSSRIYRYDLHSGSAIHNRDYQFTRKGIESYLFLFSFLVENRNRYQHSNVNLSLGLQRIIEQQFVPFMSRLLSSDFSIREVKKLRMTLINQEILPLDNLKRNNRIFNYIFKTYRFIGLYQFLYQHIFLPYIFPRLNRN